MTAHRGADDLHAAVQRLADALHAYVDVAVGVPGEAASQEDAAADPRLAVAQDAAARALDALDAQALLELGVGVRPILDESEAYEGSLDVVVDEAVDDSSSDDFFLHFVVRTPAGVSPEALDRVIDIVDEGGFDVLNRLEQAGFDVPSFGASRGAAFLVDESDLEDIEDIEDLDGSDARPRDEDGSA